MARWGWIIIAVSVLTVPGLEAGAGDFANPYKAEAPAPSKNSLPSDQFKPTQESGVTGATGAGQADALAFRTTPGGGAYRIGSSDILDISVFNVPELSKTVEVSATGTINVPLIGEIQAAGRTPQELERNLAST